MTRSAQKWSGTLDDLKRSQNLLQNHDTFTLQKRKNQCNKNDKSTLENTTLKEVLLRFSNKYDQEIKIEYRKTPLLVPGVDQFSNSNSFVLDQLVA